jgi:predicted phage terminase large subunit-like protein
VSVYDTAFEEGEENDYSARTSWGIFWHEEQPDPELAKLPAWKRKHLEVTGRWCAILLEGWKDKVEFPELRKLAVEHYKKFNPDRVLVEKKSSGHSLIQELRRAGVPVSPVKADISKLARANAAAVVLEGGCIWYLDRKWADTVIEDCATATFQRGSPGNDIGDTCVHAWRYLRRTYHIDATGDRRDEDTEDDDQPTPQPQGRRLF